MLLQVLQILTNFVVVVFKITPPSPSRSNVIELDEYGMPVNQPTQEVPPVSSMYVSRSILHSGSKWRRLEKPTKKQTPKRFRSSGSSPTIEGPVPNRQRMIDYRMGVPDPMTKKTEVKEKHQVMEAVDVKETAASPELSFQVV